MKKFLAICAVWLTATFATNALNAQEAKTMSEKDAQEVAKLETNLFSQYETLDVESDDAFAKSLNVGAEPKCCWFWYWRPTTYYYYPSCYYYYVWNCPVYRVRLRLVSYTLDVPTITVTTTTTTTTTSTTTTVNYVKTSNGRTAIAKGAVIDGKVKANTILAKLGLRSGDVITKIDGKPITNINDLKAIRTNSTISYVRGDKIKIAQKSILQKKTDAIVKNFDGFETNPIELKDVQATQGGITLYDYYDKTIETSVEPTDQGGALQQTEEYGAYEY